VDAELPTSPSPRLEVPFVQLFVDSAPELREKLDHELDTGRTPAPSSEFKIEPLTTPDHAAAI